MKVKKKDFANAKSLEVPGAGVEPARPNGHMALNHACLPIPAPGRVIGNFGKDNSIYRSAKQVFHLILTFLNKKGLKLVF